MEPASKLISRLRLPGDTITAEDIACRVWPQAVGKKVAIHTRASKLVRGRLVVEVEDRVWQRQLFTLSHQILRNLEKRLGAGMVTDLEFRIVPRRIEPRRATAPALLPELPMDDASGIEDPVLRSIYRLSKRKATA